MGPTYSTEEAYASIGGLIAPDPGGLNPRETYSEFPLEYGMVPVQQSPVTSFMAGVPFPGPFSTVWSRVDVDSRKWWGKGFRTIWDTEAGEYPILPHALPNDLAEHVDLFSGFIGGYPSFARDQPQSFGNQVPLFDPRG